LVIAMIMPASTKSTIATCIQIQVGDTAAQPTARDPARRHPASGYGLRMAAGLTQMAGMRAWRRT
jgi:hypothetical protein